MTLIELSCPVLEEEKLRKLEAKANVISIGNMKVLALFYSQGGYIRFEKVACPRYEDGKCLVENEGHSTKKCIYHLLDSPKC